MINIHGNKTCWDVLGENIFKIYLFGNHFSWNHNGQQLDICCWVVIFKLIMQCVSKWVQISKLNIINIALPLLQARGDPLILNVSNLWGSGVDDNVASVCSKRAIFFHSCILQLHHHWNTCALSTIKLLRHCQDNIIHIYNFATNFNIKDSPYWSRLEKFICCIDIIEFSYWSFGEL